MTPIISLKNQDTETNKQYHFPIKKTLAHRLWKFYIQTK